MKCLNQTSRSDLPQADRRNGQGRRSSEDRQRSGHFMAVSVEIIGSSGLGPLVSVAHYYEQNGDLMRDPDVVFLIGADRHVYPISFRQDNLGINLESAYVEDGVWKVRVKMQAQLCSFCTQWMRNVDDQQQLGVK